MRRPPVRRRVMRRLTVECTASACFGRPFSFRYGSRFHAAGLPPSSSAFYSSYRHQSTRNAQTTTDLSDTQTTKVLQPAIRHWLLKDPSWRDETWKRLDWPEHQYDHFLHLYYTSAKDFLQQNPLPSAWVTNLRRAGFVDQTFVQAYRRHKARPSNDDQRRLELVAQRHKLQNQAQHLQRQLDDLRDNQATVTPPDDAPSLWTRAWNYFLGSGDDGSLDAKPSTAPTKKQQQLRNRLERHWQRNQEKLAALRDRMDACDQQPSSSPGLSPAVLHQAQSAVGRTRVAVAQALADYMQETHAAWMAQYKNLDAHTDLTRPQEWFPYARLTQRKIIFHAGPTNSGKTFQALERLKEASRGMYLGPLRLLAVEIYEKLTLDGIYCNLYTGQDRREIPFATHGSATVEMASIVDDYDVVVIDEIQMICDAERGFAWTRALLGTRCPEIHVCGGREALPILQRLVGACGDELEVRPYERFTPLTIASASLVSSKDQHGAYANVQPGDCVVAFSRNDIFAIKREIEESSNRKCCVIYGSLPPATRSEQARLFNDAESGYDILVASDAIGMGLNLNIRRIIFNSLYKNDGSGIVRLDHSAVKQISGRAGRRNSPYPNGEVTSRCPEDLKYIRTCLETDIAPLRRAGLMPTSRHIQIFDHTLEECGMDFGSKNLHSILNRFNDMASLTSDFFLCRQTPMYKIAKSLSAFDLHLHAKYTLCMCPVMVQGGGGLKIVQGFAEKLSKGEVAGIGFQPIPRLPKSFDDLSKLCEIFIQLDVFLWLQLRFPTGSNAMEAQAAMSRKEEVIRIIKETLDRTDDLQLTHSYIHRDNRVRKEWQGNQQDNDDVEDFADGLLLPLADDDRLNRGVIDI